MVKNNYYYKDGQSEKGRIKKYLEDKEFGYIEVEGHEDIKFLKSDLSNIEKPEIGKDVTFTAVMQKDKFIAKKISYFVATISESENNDKNDRKYYLPSDSLKNIKQSEADNFSLKLNKNARFDTADKKFKFYKTDKGKLDFDDTKFDFNKIPFNGINSEAVKAVKVLFDKSHKVIKLQTDWRLVAGLGSESVYGTSITLHSIYGFPYIPGQAIKGIVRSWVISEFFERNEGKAISESKAFCKIFGCPKDISIEKRDNEGNLVKENGKKIKKESYKSILKEDHQGSVIFFDAFPTSAPKLKVDVMNPHYSDYYSNKDGNNPPPADYYNPIPIYFLTVEETEFQFLIGIKEKNNEKIKGDTLGDESFLNLAEKYLKEALQNQGVGAKSAVGYGYFRE